MSSVVSGVVGAGVGHVASPVAGADWDTRALDSPLVISLAQPWPSAEGSGRSRGLADLAADALAASAAAGPAAAGALVARLGLAGVVALRDREGVYEVRETLLGWILAPTRCDPNLIDLAAAAKVRAANLAALRGWAQRRGSPPGPVGGPARSRP